MWNCIKGVEDVDIHACRKFAVYLAGKGGNFSAGVSSALKVGSKQGIVIFFRPQKDSEDYRSDFREIGNCMEDK